VEGDERRRCKRETDRSERRIEIDEAEDGLYDAVRGHS